MSRLLGLLLLLAAGPALAAAVTVSWVNPTQRTDGSPLPSSAIGETYVEWGTCAAGGTFGSLVGNKSAPGAGTSLVTPDLAPGTYCFRAFTKTTTGLSSGPSAVVSKVITAPEVPPNPPAITTVVTVAWEIQPTKWGEAKLVRVGRVALGVPCGAPLDWQAGLYELDPATVKTTGKYTGGTLYGQCAES